MYTTITFTIHTTDDVDLAQVLDAANEARDALHGHLEAVGIVVADPLDTEVEVSEHDPQFTIASLATAVLVDGGWQDEAGKPLTTKQAMTRCLPRTGR